MQVSTCVLFEQQLVVIALTCGNFEHAQISSQVEATCYINLCVLAIRLNALTCVLVCTGLIRVTLLNTLGNVGLTLRTALKEINYCSRC
jgi:hypothetical protein